MARTYSVDGIDRTQQFKYGARSRTLIPRRSLSAAIILALSLLLALAPPPTSIASYLILSIHAMIGRKAAIQSLAIAWLISVLNPALAESGSYDSIGKSLVLLCAAASVYGRVIASGGYTINSGVFYTVSLGALLIMHSMLFSAFPEISVLKASMWCLVISTVLLAFSEMSESERDSISRWLYSGAVLIMIVGWPLVFLPEGYTRNGRGFQGILNHPQAYSVFLAILATWAMSRLLHSRQGTMLSAVIVGSAVVALVLSRGRTGGFSFVLATLIGTGIYIFLRAKHNEHFLGLRKKITFGLFAISIVLIGLTPTLWFTYISDFAFKSGGYGDIDLAEVYESSRGRLVDRAWDNFMDHPLTGIGFGVDINRVMAVVYDPVLGLPVSAPIEKGNIYVSTLEEIGGILAALFALWLLYFMRRAVANGPVQLNAALCVAFLNLGEANFFSPGGMGLITIIVFGLATTGPLPRRR